MSKSIARQSTHQPPAFFFSENSKAAPIRSCDMKSIGGSGLVKPASQMKNRRLAYVDPDPHYGLLMYNNSPQHSHSNAVVDLISFSRTPRSKIIQRKYFVKKPIDKLFDVAEI